MMLVCAFAPLRHCAEILLWMKKEKPLRLAGVLQVQVGLDYCSAERFSR
jgi:hypothetical protein